MYFSLLLRTGPQQVFLMVEGLSKNIGHHVWPTKTNFELHWIKRSKTVPPKKRNFDQKINYSKPHISSLLISDFHVESLKANKTSKKDRSIYNTISVKKPHLFFELLLIVLPQHSQKPYFIYTARKMKFSIEDFFSKCYKIWSRRLGYRNP